MLAFLIYVGIKFVLIVVQIVLITSDYPDGTYLKAYQDYCFYCLLAFLFLWIFLNAICFSAKCKYLYGEAVHTFAAFLWVAVYLTFMFIIGPFIIHAKTSLSNESVLDDPIPENKIPADDCTSKGKYLFRNFFFSIVVLIGQILLLKFSHHIYALYNSNHGETVMIPPGNENILNPAYDPPPTYDSAVNFENEIEPVETPPPLYGDLPRNMRESIISQHSDVSTENEPPPPPNSPATPPPYVRSLSNKNHQGSLDSTPPPQSSRSSSFSLSTDREEDPNHQLPPRKSSESFRSADQEDESTNGLRSRKSNQSLSADQEEHSNLQLLPMKSSESSLSLDQEEEYTKKLH